MIKDFIAYINEGLFDRNQSEFVIIKTDKGIEQIYIPKTKEELHKYIDLDIEQAKKDETYPNVDLNNIDVSELGDDALEGLFNYKIYTINPDISNWDIKYIPKKFFYGNEQIEEFTIPNSVTRIGSDVFWSCSDLKSITIPNSVTSIGEWAFESCSSLTKTNYTGDIAGWCSINFGNYSANPTAYSHNLYINDVEVKDLMIPNSVTSIGNYAFYGCDRLESVTIPNSVTSIGDRAFEECSCLTSVTIGNSVTSIGYCTFQNCRYLTSVTIPNSVNSIGEWAFEDCNDLKYVTISKHCHIDINSFPENCKIIRRDD